MRLPLERARGEVVSAILPQCQNVWILAQRVGSLRRSERKVWSQVKSGSVRTAHEAALMTLPGPSWASS